MMDELTMAIREAINSADGAAATPDDLLDLQAAAAVEAITRLGNTAAGYEYGVRHRGVIEELGFNTAKQAEHWATQNLKDQYLLIRRPVGTWEEVR